MTKPGFTLLELIVVLLITSMIGTILTTALYQSSRIQRTVDVLFDTSVRLAVFNHQIQKDFSGAFIPTQARLKDDKDDEEAEQKGEDQKAAESKEPKKAEKKEKEDTEQSPKKVSKPSEKPVQKIFL